jgi:hypothetical protein
LILDLIKIGLFWTALNLFFLQRNFFSVVPDTAGPGYGFTKDELFFKFGRFLINDLPSLTLALNLFSDNTMIAKDLESLRRNGSSTFRKKLGSVSLPPQDRQAQLLLHRADLTDALVQDGLQPGLVYERAQTYRELGYADLAAADAYLALTLTETGLDPDHSDLQPVTVIDGDVVPWPPEDDQDAASVLKIKSMKLLAACLIELGCLQDAYDFCVQLDEASKDDPETETEREQLSDLIRQKYQAMHGKPEPLRQGEDLDLATAKLPNSGFARREVYPWNEHEPDRSSPGALQELNNRLKAVAPNLEVRSTNLPVLHDLNILPYDHETTTSTTAPTSLQLGLFATRPLPPSTPILRERSTLTAMRTLHASLCDNCCAPLPSLSSPSPPIPCPQCSGDAIFCSPACQLLAQSLYHPLLCGNDDGLDEIGRDPFSQTPAEDLYFLLVARAVAMAAHQGVHPLDLPQVQYLWGDFGSDDPDSAPPPPPPAATLPFTFQHNVVLPFRFLSTLALTHPELSPGSACYLRNYDAWVVATLLAKCRGVASARQSTWDGRPEVAAVHPMWCLANHSCSPNVEWAWGQAKRGDDSGAREGGEEGQQDGEEGARGGDSEIVFKVRDKVVWKRPASEQHGEGEEEWQGVKAGEEILNHYCDVRLPVGERREWASGALGGHCMCERCVWESQQTEGELADGVRRKRITTQLQVAL